jgi:acyl-CoA reductase-like NAD-dependent aldehyde dehydrogenase
MDVAGRRAVLERLAARIEADRDSLARQMAVEIGKPVRQGRAEAVRAAALLRAAARADAPDEEVTGPGVVCRRRPVGVIGVVTPWNNPLAIPAGKLAPALLYGNTVAWKPAPAGSAVALRLVALLHEAGCPPGVVNLVSGDRSTAAALMHGDLDAVTLSGSLAAGYAAGEICGRRHLPLQAELGGNNAAIVWSDADLVSAAGQLAEAAFGFAGQRCTANRRVIVEAGCSDTFVEALVVATARLIWGDPLDEAAQVGPLISRSARDRVASLVARAETSGHPVLVPSRVGSPRRRRLCAEEGFQPQRGSARPAPPAAEGAYYPPTLVLCDDPGHEIVQEETFGPVLVVQRASGWREALDLCSGVRQGLAAALFSGSPERQAEFLEEARAGVLKINRPTTDVDAVSPFGDWKASGIGPPEHGEGNRQFYTRLQSVYQ